MNKNSIRYIITRDTLALFLGILILVSAIVFRQEWSTERAKADNDLHSFEAAISRDQDLILLQAILKSHDGLSAYSAALKQRAPKVDFCIAVNDLPGRSVNDCNAKFAAEGLSGLKLIDKKEFEVIYRSNDQTFKKLIIASVGSSPLLLVALCALLVGIFLNLRLRSLISDPLMQLVESLNNIGSGGTFVYKKINRDIQEWSEIDSMLHDLVGRLVHINTLSRAAAKVELAKKVAHDIRSPLTALNVVVKMSTDMPDEKSKLIRSAVRRINDIANSLLECGSNQISLSDSTMLTEIVTQIISEKRLQYRGRSGLEIDLDLTNSYALFTKVDRAEIGRLLSNLIDNSVEAISETGRVVVALSFDEQYAIISTVDNGRGIPAEILPELGRRELSYDKARGHGLGLYHGRRFLESCGGEMKIESMIGRGTKIQVLVPRSMRPSWILEKIVIEPNSIVAIIDDDTSVHQVWSNQFVNVPEGAELKYFLTTKDLRNWLVTQEPNRKIHYFVDFEFSGENVSGLDVIEDLGISRSAALVTSHYDDATIRERAAKMGVQTIPKGMISQIPIIGREVQSHLLQV